MGRMKEYYIQLIEEGKMRDPNLEMHNDDAYWAHREYWEQQSKKLEDDDNYTSTDIPDGDNSSV
jgi:uncharacterized membrane protein YcaP (DUF421 family)